MPENVTIHSTIFFNNCKLYTKVEPAWLGLRKNAVVDDLLRKNTCITSWLFKQIYLPKTTTTFCFLYLISSPFLLLYIYISLMNIHYCLHRAARMNCYIWLMKYPIRTSSSPSLSHNQATSCQQRISVRSDFLLRCRRLSCRNIITGFLHRDVLPPLSHYRERVCV